MISVVGLLSTSNGDGVVAFFPTLDRHTLCMPSCREKYLSSESSLTRSLRLPGVFAYLYSCGCTVLWDSRSRMQDFFAGMNIKTIKI